MDCSAGAGGYTDITILDVVVSNTETGNAWTQCQCKDILETIGFDC